MPDYIITNGDILLRRVPNANPNYWKILDGKRVASSFAFKTKPGEDGLSVSIAALTTLQNAAGNSDQFSVAAIPASVPTELGYQCRHDPKLDNEAHALIVGDTNPIAKKLSIAAVQVL